MPTSHPWNPNPEIAAEDQARGHYVEPCMANPCGPECVWCNGKGEIHAPLPKYRPDRKIRCYLGLPNTSFNWLAWDAEQIADLKNRINRGEKYLRPLRGWDRNTYEIKPAAIHMFRQVDKDPL